MPVVDVLKASDVYPHPVDNIEVLETHISWVFLTGDYVYKLKKPLDFGFLNFSSLEARKYYCKEELRLNKRITKQIYLEVCALCFDGKRYWLSDEEAPQAIEYVVKMKQFDNQQQLDILLSQPEFQPGLIDEFAAYVARLHKQQPSAPKSSTWGNPTGIWDIVEDNFERPLELLPSPADRDALSELYSKVKKQFLHLKPVFEQRKAEGYIRECHGDLHLTNIALIHDSLQPFDCIEFNEQFRWIDTYYDLAFLLMDLDANHQQRLANRCINSYLAESGDYQGIQTLNFYKLCRATVQAKVALIGKEIDYTRYQHYFELAQSYVLSTKPQLYITYGLSGNGKSVVSQTLSEHFGLIWLRADTERKRLAKNSENQSLDLYGTAMNQITAKHLYQQCQTLLGQGFSVIVDATFIRKNTRKNYIELAKHLQIPFAILNCICSTPTREQRLIDRKLHGKDPSDADVNVMREQQKYKQQLSKYERRYVIDIDTEQSLLPIIAELEPQ